MVKRIKILLLLLFMFLIIPFSIKAASFSLKLDCPKNSSAGKTVKCSLTISQTGGIGGVKGNFSLDKKLSYDSFTINSKATFHIQIADKDGFSFINVDGFPKSLELGVLKVKIPSTAKAGDSFKVTINNVQASDTASNDYIGSDVVSTIKIASNVNTLSSLNVTGAEIDFKPGTLNYSATIDNTSVTISATVTDSSASIKGAGTKTLKYGKNDFNIVVTAEDGSKKTYVLSITRPDHRNTNNYLKSLSIDAGSIIFDKDTTTYNLSVDKNTTTVKISAEVEDGKASFLKNYGPRTVTLKNGNNEMLIKVSAENEKVKTYTINVNKEDGRSSDTTLSTLSITPGSISFNKDITSYNVSVSNDVTTVIIDATASDSNATVKVDGPKELEDGDNIYKVTVTAENGSTNTYTITVTRSKESVISKNENRVKSISVKDYDLKFDPNITEYEVSTTEDKLDININLLEGTEYRIEGNENLKPGSVIKIIVKETEGREKTYRITIVEDKELSTIQLASIIGIVLANIVVLILLIKSKASK